MQSSPGWRARIAANGTSVVIAQCASASSMPPRVAFLIGGAARTFGTNLLLATLRHHFLERLAPDATARHVFLYLKSMDSDKSGGNEGSVSFAARTAPLTRILVALDLPWLRRSIREAVVIKGSGSFAGVGWAPQPSEPSAHALRQSDSEAWRAYRQPSGSQACKPPFGSRAKNKAANSSNQSRSLVNSSIKHPPPPPHAPPPPRPPRSLRLSTTVDPSRSNQEQRMLEAAYAIAHRIKDHMPHVLHRRPARAPPMSSSHGRHRRHYTIHSHRSHRLLLSR